jgi:hypothetical protein
MVLESSRTIQLAIEYSDHDGLCRCGSVWLKLLQGLDRDVGDELHFPVLRNFE